MRYQGKLVNWKDDKGFGFVEPDGGGQRAFVHIKAFKPRSRRPVEGDVIRYTLVQQSGDKYKAEAVKFAAENSRSKQPVKTKGDEILATRVTILFLIGMLFSVAIGYLSAIVICLYLMMSFITYIAYAIDKSAARNERWRTKENTLHVLALLGGWPGAFFAQTRLRHKSVKKEFKLIYRATVIINLVGLAWLYSEQGLHFSNFLESIIVSLLDGF